MLGKGQGFGRSVKRHAFVPGLDRREGRTQARRPHDRDEHHVRLRKRGQLHETFFTRAHGHLAADGRVYECFCTRRQIRAEIEAAPSAPHLPPDAYPGTCRDLTAERTAELRAAGRTPALRLRAARREDEVEAEEEFLPGGSVGDRLLRAGATSEQQSQGGCKKALDPPTFTAGQHGTGRRTGLPGLRRRGGL